MAGEDIFFHISDFKEALLKNDTPYVNWNCMTGDSETKDPVSSDLYNRAIRTANDVGRDSLVLLMHDTKLAIEQSEDDLPITVPDAIKGFSAGKYENAEFTSGREFPDDVTEYALVLHCGGCMITERDVMSRMEKAKAQNIPFTNYGITIAYMNGILKRSIEVFPELNKLI